jgi:large subunit ribosomal protein L29
MKNNELRSLSDGDLTIKEKALKKELFDMRYQRKIGRVEKPHRFQEIRKDIARILTIINERKKEQHDGTQG